MSSDQQIVDLLSVDSKIFQQQALTAEQNGRWPEEWLELSKKRKLFHLAVPKKYGGRQLSLPMLLQFIEEASKLDGSFGWTLTLGIGAGIFAAFMHPSFAKTFFADPLAYITGSGYPAGTAQQINGTYTGSGKWKYATGSPHATLFTTVCQLKNNLKSETKNETNTKILAFLPEEVTIQAAWNSYGLQATASNDFEAASVKIPDERTFKLTEEYLQVDNTLYRFPFEAFAQATLAVSLLGIAEHFQDEALNVFQQNKSDFISEIEAAKSSLKRARDQLFGSTNQAWLACQSHQPITEEKQHAITKSVKNMTLTALQNARILYSYCGMKVLDKNSVINRAWRDLHTASQHALLNPLK